MRERDGEREEESCQLVVVVVVVVNFLQITIIMICAWLLI